MQESQVNVGASVVTADGQPAGRVIAIRDQDFIVEGGIFIKYIWSYQFADVTKTMPDRVELKIDTLALEQSWSVTEWSDSDGVAHHIRQVGVPMSGMPAAPDMAQNTGSQQAV